MQHVLRCWWLSFLVLAACFDPQFEDRHIQCGPDESCPPGMMCVGGFCSTHPQNDATAQATLTVALGGNSMGTVTSSPSGIDCGATCAKAFPIGTAVTLTATPTSGSIFVGWSGACSGTGTCAVTLDTSITVTANFAVDNTLVVVRAGNGSGVVSSNPAGINCGADCNEQYPQNTSVVLTASAATGSQFDGWSGGGCSGIGTCTVTTDTAKMVTATFSLTQHTLTITPAGNGTGTVTSPAPSSLNCGTNCVATVNYGSMVTLTATPATGSTFTSWSGGGCTGNATTCTVTISQATDVTATFTLTQHTISVTKAGNGSGNVQSGEASPAINCGSTCSHMYDYGTTVTLGATPSVGSTFAGWSPSNICTGTGSCVIDVTMAASVTATFTLNAYTLTAAKSGNGVGTITSDVAGISCGTDCSEPYNYGTVVVLTPMAATGSTFNGWSGVSGCPGTGTCTVTVTQAATATGNFTLDTENLTVSKTGTGAGTITGVGINCPGDCSEPFDYGTNVTLTATASTGSTFIGWTGGGCGSAGTGSCVVPMTQAQNVQAQFTLQTFALNVTLQGTGTGTVTSNDTPTALINCGSDCTETYGYGSSITLTASPTTGTNFTGWTGASGCTTGLTCVVNVTQLTNVTATFTLQTKTLSVGTSGNGTCTITSDVGGISCGSTCAALYNYGSPVQLSAVPANGSVFVGWTAPAGCSGNGTCNVTMTATTTATANCVLGTTPFTVTKNGTGSGTVVSSEATPLINCGADCSEPYTNGTNVTLTATPATGSTFTGWSGACSGTGTCSFQVSAATTGATATFTLDQHSLTVQKTGTGGGVVKSSEIPTALIDCGSTCTHNYSYGTSVTLTATPDASSQFNGWTGGGCTGTGNCIVTTNADTTVQASFVPLTYLLTIQKTGNGAANGTVSASGIACGADCSESYNAGTIVHLVASVTTGTQFNGWTNAPGCTTASTCDVTMNAASTVKADFSLIPYSLNVSLIGGATAGTVTSSDIPQTINCGGDCTDTYNYGTVVTLTATQATGYTFTGWSNLPAGQSCPGTGSCQITINGPSTATATFTLNSYALTVNVAGNGSGSVSSSPVGITCGAAYAVQDCTENYNHGTSVTLTESTQIGTNFTGWTGGGCTGSTNPTCVVSMTAVTSVTANFTLKQYTVSIAKSGLGSGGVTSVPSGITCGLTCSKLFDYGTSVMLTETPAAGSSFNTWSGVAGCGNASTCTFTVTADTPVGAKFDVIPANKAWVSAAYPIVSASGPSISSLAAADNICKNEAASISLPGTYKAYLSASTAPIGEFSDATNRIGNASGWVRMDGKPFANTKADLINGKFFSAPRVKIDGSFDNSGASSYLATATNGSGVYAGNGDCSNFMSNSGTVLIAAGRADAGAFQALNWGTVGCNASFRLLCLGVDNQAVVQPTQPASYRRAFMLPISITAGGSITNIDTACQNMATSKGFSGTFKALLPTSGQTAIGRTIGGVAVFDTSAGAANWYRTDWMPILPSAASWANAAITNWDSPPNVSADGQTYYSNYGVTLGATNYNTAPTASSAPTDTCTDWSDNGSGSGHTFRIGSSAWTTQSLYFANSPPSYGNCSFAGNVVCLQQ